MIWAFCSVFVLLIAVTNSKPNGNTDLDDQWRIKGGHDAVKGAYPWQVTIRIKDQWLGTYSHKCGGSIINSQWIVSAAHCFRNEKASDYVVVAGEHDFRKDEGTEQLFNVQKLIKHEGYYMHIGNNDIALLKINGEFKFNDHVSPIPLALPEQNAIIEGNSQLQCMASGWGRLSFLGSTPSILQALEMPLLPLKTCKDAFWGTRNSYNVTEDMLCTGHIKGDKSPCHGDSGGPLACKINDKWTLAGIVSWGKECGVSGYPGLFARVSHFHKWITNKVANN